jgi:hypothetical protein
MGDRRLAAVVVAVPGGVDDLVDLALEWRKGGIAKAGS